MKKYLSIGEVSKITNVPTSKLRFYDKEGLLSPKLKKESRYRYYSSEQLILIKKIVTLRNLGFTLKEIKEFFGNEKNEEKDSSLIKNVLVRVQEEIKKLKSIEKELVTDLNKSMESRKLRVPFIDEAEEKKGIWILKEITVDKEENMLNMIKNVIKHEEKGYKILSHIIRKKIEDLDKENSLENGYITTDNPELNNTVIFKKGRYASILGKGEFEVGTVISKLFSWIKDNNFKIIGEYANIIFNPEGISVKSKKDVPYEIKVLIE